MGIWMASHTRIGDFVTAMEQMRMPRGLSITVAVALRYLPTIRHEFYYIKNTMKLRGIGLNLKNTTIRPVKTIEYALVPMVIRCFTIADELSASVMTRGLDLETKRTPFREVRIRRSDVLVTLSFTAAIVSVRILSGYLKGEAT
jgi:energy-coupling factor transport system permease protein